jgi:hypothetical protein
MAKTWMLPACFEHFGVLVSNHHFSLTAVSKDGTIVVVAMWEDEFERRESRQFIKQNTDQFSNAS